MGNMIDQWEELKLFNSSAAATDENGLVSGWKGAKELLTELEQDYDIHTYLGSEEHPDDRGTVYKFL